MENKSSKVNKECCRHCVFNNGFDFKHNDSCPCHKEVNIKCEFCKGYPDGDYGKCGKCRRSITYFSLPDTNKCEKDCDCYDCSASNQTPISTPTTDTIEEECDKYCGTIYCRHRPQQEIKYKFKQVENTLQVVEIETDKIIGIWDGKNWTKVEQEKFTRCTCDSPNRNNNIHSRDCGVFSPQQENIEVVPSPRIDWCGECKKEHGYDCPQENIEWEEPSLEWQIKSLVQSLRGATEEWQRDSIKSFINKQLSIQESNIVSKYESLLEKAKEEAYHKGWNEGQMNVLKAIPPKEELLAEREALLWQKMEEMKKPLQEKHDKLQKQYQLAYDKWFKYGHRGEKLEAELKSFESGAEGNIMSDCYAKIEALSDVQLLLNKKK